MVSCVEDVAFPATGLNTWAWASIPFSWRDVLEPFHVGTDRSHRQGGVVQSGIHMCVLQRQIPPHRVCPCVSACVSACVMSCICMCFTSRVSSAKWGGGGGGGGGGFGRYRHWLRAQGVTLRDTKQEAQTGQSFHQLGRLLGSWELAGRAVWGLVLCP